jgi:hypothetical protein
MMLACHDSTPNQQTWGVRRGRRNIPRGNFAELSWASTRRSTTLHPRIGVEGSTSTVDWVLHSSTASCSSSVHSP